MCFWEGVANGKRSRSFKIWTDESGRRIVYSRGTGIAHAHEIAWLYETLVEFSKEWHDDKGFVYMAFIEELEQVSPKGSIQYVELHRNLEACGCKYIAYIEGNSYEVSVQSYKHKQMSNTPLTQNRYFPTQYEGLKWFEEMGF